MAYTVAADYRAETPQPWTAGLTLTDVEAGDTLLTDTIAEISDQVDETCSDHFSSSAAGTVILIDSGGFADVYVPRRIQALTLVETRDWTGNWYSELSTVYRFEAFTG